jgi:hypothetical protein
MATMAKGLSKFGPGGVRIVFDPKDPDTPCMVYLGKSSATFFCALDTGEMDCGAGPDLTQQQLDWLAGFETQAAEFALAVQGPR